MIGAPAFYWDQFTLAYVWPYVVFKKMVQQGGTMPTLGQKTALTAAVFAACDALDGVTVNDLDADARQALQIPDDIKGALVTDVQQGSHADDAGLHKGDVIMSIDRHPVSNADDAVKLSNAAKGTSILLKVWSHEGDSAGTRYLSVDNTKASNKDGQDNQDNQDNNTDQR